MRIASFAASTTRDNQAMTDDTDPWGERTVEWSLQSTHAADGRRSYFARRRSHYEI